MIARKIIPPAASETYDGDPILPDIVIAAYVSDYESIQHLLETGADINSVDIRDNLSLLHIACMQGDERLVKILLDYDKENGNLDFSIRSLYRPRLAWQLAMNAHHYELARIVDEASFRKQKLPQKAPDLKPI